jgi:diamine N-acetyltransferase
VNTGLEKRPVRREHLPELIALEVRADQHGLVTANLRTLAEAAYEPGAAVWGLWAGDVAVGLLAMIDFRLDPEPYSEVDADAAYLWRLLIGAEHQGKGYGSAALAMAVEVARGWGYARLMAGVSDVPHSNLGFYVRHGFRVTDRVAEGDRMITLEVAEFRIG